MKKYKYTIVACARWESSFIVEWINYYRAIGFDHICIYCNDDDPRQLYEVLLPFLNCESPFVTFRFYPVQGEQLQMYAHFLRNDREKTEWISFFDIDEYLRLPENSKIDDYVAEFDENVDCIMFNWIFFGPNGHRENPGKRILSEYTKRQNKVHPYTKFIARADVLSGADLYDSEKGNGFWHNPLPHIDNKIRAVNVLNEDMSNYYDGFADKADAFVNEPERKNRILSSAIIHHYAFRTETAFQDRVKRGLGGAFSGQHMWGEIAKNANFDQFVAGLNEIEDRSLENFWSRHLESKKIPKIYVAQGRKNLSKNRKCSQSSTSTWSKKSEIELDARGAVNGDISGGYGFHTDIEDGAWWQVDLGAVAGIDEIKIYNRMDQKGVAERSSKIAIDMGLNEQSFVEVFRRELDEPFGGVDGDPLTFNPVIPIPARFVRIRLLVRNYLHLDEVEVFGELLPCLNNDKLNSRMS